MQTVPELVQDLLVRYARPLSYRTHLRNYIASLPNRPEPLKELLSEELWAPIGATIEAHNYAVLDLVQMVIKEPRRGVRSLWLRLLNESCRLGKPQSIFLR